MQLTDQDKHTLEELGQNLRVLTDDNGKKFVETKYLFKENPLKIFGPDKSNRAETLKQTKKAVNKMLRSLSMTQVQQLYQRGHDEGCLDVQSPMQEQELLSKPHWYTYTQIAFNDKSSSTPI